MPVGMPGTFWRPGCADAALVALQVASTPGLLDAWATSNERKLLLGRVATAVALVEAMPHDALRAAHPRERWLEDLRLAHPELIVGCWASG